jgi:hypothetical protein
MKLWACKCMLVAINVGDPGVPYSYYECWRRTLSKFSIKGNAKSTPLAYAHTMTILHQHTRS